MLERNLKKTKLRSTECDTVNFDICKKKGLPFRASIKISNSIIKYTRKVILCTVTNY